jgi:hypothetical protein
MEACICADLVACAGVVPPLYQARGYAATYLMLYLATGEAPEEIRNVFRQRSRWTKGHFQVGTGAIALAGGLQWGMPPTRPRYTLAILDVLICDTSMAWV